MTPLLRRASQRFFRRHPVQFGLTLLGIALGVATVVAVDIANESAGRAFAASVETLQGSATHSLKGGPDGLDESFYVDFQRQWGHIPAAPVIEGYVRYQDQPYRFIGVDPLHEGRFDRGYRLPGDDRGGAQLMARPGSVLTSIPEAPETLTVTYGGRSESLTRIGSLGEAPGTELEPLFIADIATAQAVLQRLGRLDRIDLVLKPTQVDAVRASLPEAVRLQPAERRSEALADMTRGFRINLVAMSLLAVVVGGFLIYNAIGFSVLSRRHLWGQLRSLGVTPRQILGLVLFEAAVLGLIGSLVGLLLGVVLGQWLIDLVTRTINDLYFVLRVQGDLVQPVSLAKGLVLGPMVALLAAAVPALEAARVPPRAALIQAPSGNRRWIPGLAVAGLVLLGLSGLSILAASRSLTIPFLGVLLGILGVAGLMPWIIQHASRLTRPLLARALGPVGRLAAGALGTGVSRNALAAAALTAAVASAIGVGVMIDSFRGAVSDWLDQVLTSDLYVTVPRVAPGEGGGFMPPGLPAAVEATPGVTEVRRLRQVRLETSSGDVSVTAVELEAMAPDRTFIAGGDRDAIWQQLIDGQGVAVTESFAYRRGLDPGDRLRLPTPQGPRAFPVLGVYQDYSSDAGVVLMDLAHFRSIWRDDRVNSLGIELAPSVTAAGVEESIRALPGGDRLAFTSDQAIREQSLTVFDRTFQVTLALRVLILGVAFVGVLGALAALELERHRELAVLRALGVTGRQVGGSVLTHTLLLGLIAGLVAIPLGFALAATLTEVINQRAFGWTMPLSLAPGHAVQALGLALLAALLAALYPSWRAARAIPAAALKEE
jgi:putative ABC transport system permease protein